jgi:hypothetical protein
LLEKLRKIRPDLLLLLSLLFLILIHPALDNNDLGRFILGTLTFVSVILATVRLAELKVRLWPLLLLMLAILIAFVVDTISPGQKAAGTEWALLTLFFGAVVVRLFSYIKNAQAIEDAHLYTAVSIYLLIGVQWFALYSAIDTFFPGAFIDNISAQTSHQTQLLYFSLVTLATIGYGDIVPRYGEVRILAALEGILGVLYVAITVAILVSSYKRRGGSE